MSLLFDTSVAIALRDSDPRVIGRSAKLPDFPAISVVTAVELEGGVRRSAEGQAIRREALDEMYEVFDIRPFGRQEAVIYGEIVAAIGFVRSKVIDRMIAATAIANDLPLATLNPSDFEEVPGLRVEAW